MRANASTYSAASRCRSKSFNGAQPSRAIVRRGGQPVWRDGVVTDNGNCILDVHNLRITDPLALEADLNQITGVVCVGLFARRPAAVVLIGGSVMP
jgi:ribose 5-phosphate isomerase A